MYYSLYIYIYMYIYIYDSSLRISPPPFIRDSRPNISPKYLSPLLPHAVLLLHDVASLSLIHDLLSMLSFQNHPLPYQLCLNGTKLFGVLQLGQFSYGPSVGWGLICGHSCRSVSWHLPRYGNSVKIAVIWRTSFKGWWSLEHHPTRYMLPLYPPVPSQIQSLCSVRFKGHPSSVPEDPEQSGSSTLLSNTQQKSRG